MVWEALKAYFRGQMISRYAHMTKMTKIEET